MKQETDNEEITSDMLNDVRWEIPCVIEEVGAIAAFLREAIADTDSGNIRGAAMVTNDCLECFANLESRLSEMAVTVAKWTEYAEQEGGTDDY
jgi:hypothetical protein